ncbi:MAG: hypothetical protein JW844_00470 [Candidatus Omnitrophica bacterium]|nr:hypothetical protein [Candidatus Omnitrophota bacterium]
MKIRIWAVVADLLLLSALIGALFPGGEIPFLLLIFCAYLYLLIRIITLRRFSTK